MRWSGSRRGLPWMRSARGARRRALARRRRTGRCSRRRPRATSPHRSDSRRVDPSLAAAFEHVHMLVFHPRDAAPAALQALLYAGWSTTDIVTLSQIVAFLSFQIRVVTGLRTLADRP